MLTQTVANRVYDFSHAVGGRPLRKPNALALGQGDEMYAILRVGYAVRQVNRLNIGAEAGDEEVLGQFGSFGEGEGEFVWPVGIAVDSRYNVYVTDEWLNRISVFDQEGNFQYFWGTAGDGDGQLNRPSGIAVDRDDNFYIVDTLKHRVQTFTKDGGFLAKWGGPGDGPGEFDSPWGITVDGQGYVYVADHKNHRVQKLSPDGEFVAEFGSYGTGRGQLSHPTDVAVDPDGDVYICDWANNRVQLFTPDGRFLTSFIGDAQHLSKWMQRVVDANPDVVKARRRAYTLEPEWRLALPMGVVFDNDRGRLIIADTHRWRVQIYNKLKDYDDPQFNL